VSSSRVSAASVALLGAALAAVAFGAAGGTELGRTTVVELLLVIASAAVVAIALAYGPPGSLYGGTALVAFAALTLVTGLSILWSIAPDLSFIEAGRSLAYLAVFAAAVAAARLAPGHAPVLLKAVLLAASVVAAYAIASRVWPETLAPHELSNRIGKPYSYWNAVGTTAALLVPAALWLGARRTGTVVGRALAYPALGLAMLAILLTQSRGALAAAALGAIAWFAIVPLRLRSLPVLLVPAVGVAPGAAWALSKTAFSEPFQPLAVKENVAGEFGGFVLLMVVLLLLAGLAVGFGLARKAPPVYVRRRVGIVALVAVCAVPLVLFTSVAFSDRGIGGTIGDRVDELTSENASAPTEGAGRLTAASNSRSAFWREAWKVFEHRKGLGTGAGTFANARLRYRKNEQVSRHAHGFVPQAMSDTGLLGLGVSLALLLAWAVAAARTTGLYPRRLPWRGRASPRRDWDSERIALVGLTLVAVVFGLQSLIDWTWFVPGPAVMALVAAGFVAGRGPIPALAPQGAPAGMPTRAGMRPLVIRGPGRPPRARVAAAAAALLTALLFAWAIWQPEASDRAADSALDLASEGDLQAAAAKADDAADADKLSPKPLLVKAAVQTQMGDRAAAGRTLERAVLRYPSEPLTWLRLASFQLDTLDRPVAAARTVGGVLYLDPKSKAGRRLLEAARGRYREQQLQRASSPASG
jgi:tetratricopeptide (TPR) repeat protein